MHSIPVKDRWWRSRAKEDHHADWYCLETDVFPFESGWARLGAKVNSTDSFTAQIGEIARYEDCIVDQLDGCPACKRWDMSNVHQPVNMILAPSNKKTKTFSPRFYKNAWITNVYGLSMSIVHRRLLDVIGPYLDESILIGDVFVAGGDQVHDLATVIDKAALPCRCPYRKSLFNSPASRNYFACLHCGSFRYFGKDIPGYVLSSEHLTRKPRFYAGALLLSPEIMASTDFLTKEKWPKLKCHKVKEYSVQRDPFPSPMPSFWDELESFFQSKGVEFPFHKVCHIDENMKWANDRMKKLGQESALTDVVNIQGQISADVLATIVFYLRFRAIVEPEVAKRIGHWTDQQIMQFVCEYREDTNWLIGYFPV